MIEVDQVWEVQRDFPPSWDLCAGDKLLVVELISWPNDPPKVGPVVTCISPKRIYYMRGYQLQDHCLLRQPLRAGTALELREPGLCGPQIGMTSSHTENDDG